MSRFAVILPAAGRSTRFGGPRKKPYLSLGDRPVFLRALDLFVNRPDVAQVLLVVAADDLDGLRDSHGGILSFMGVALVAGGVERFESVANALALLSDGVTHVAVHDAVRPLATPGLIDAVFAECVEHGAALPGVPVADTLKRVDAAGRVTETVPRAGLWAAQTPQCSRRDWLEAAYAARAALGNAITDDAQLVEAAGHPVRVVPGLATNFKITTPADLALAEAILRPAPPEPPRKGRPFDNE